MDAWTAEEGRSLAAFVLGVCLSPATKSVAVVAVAAELATGRLVDAPVSPVERSLCAD